MKTETRTKTPHLPPTPYFIGHLQACPDFIIISSSIFGGVTNVFESASVFCLFTSKCLICPPIILFAF